MDMKLFWIFVALSVVNVVLSTIKSIMTIKSGKVMASLINAVYFGLYTVVVIYTVCDLPLWLKVAVTAITNLIGVFVVKWIEEKMRKDKLWKVEATIPAEYTNAVHFDLKSIPHNYIENVGRFTLFNFYCATQAESAKVKEIINQYGAKYFVAESQTL